MWAKLIVVAVNVLLASSAYVEPTVWPKVFFSCVQLTADEVLSL